MYVDEVAIRKDILKSQVGNSEIDTAEKEDTQQELGLVGEIWGLVGVMNR